MNTLRVDTGQEVAFAGSKSYFGAGGFTAGQNGYWIDRTFFMSNDFDKILIKVLFKYYPKEFEKFLIENEGFACSIGDVNQIMDRIKDINLIKYIAQERDGFINQITLPEDGNGDILDGDDWLRWAKENLKPTDIVFVNYS